MILTFLSISLVKYTLLTADLLDLSAATSNDIHTGNFKVHLLQCNWLYDYMFCLKVISLSLSSLPPSLPPSLPLSLSLPPSFSLPPSLFLSPSLPLSLSLPPSFSLPPSLLSKCIELVRSLSFFAFAMSEFVNDQWFRFASFKLWRQSMGFYNLRNTTENFYK